MPASNRLRRALGPLIAVVLTACGGQTVSPSAPSAPTLSTVASPAGSSAATASAGVSTGPSSSASSSAAGLGGQIVFEDSGQDFQLTQI